MNHNVTLAVSNSKDILSPRGSKELKSSVTNVNFNESTINTLEELLKKIDLSSSKINTIPLQIKNYSSLTELKLENNRITHLPKHLFEISHLRVLNLSNNTINAIPPQFVAFWTSLEELYISKNLLTSLPTSLSQCSTLKIIDARKNSITTIPPEIGDIISLRELKLSQNQITTIPPQLCRLKKLRKLYLDFNEITTLPEKLSSLSKMKIMKFKGNKLTVENFENFKTSIKIDLRNPEIPSVIKKEVHPHIENTQKTASLINTNIITPQLFDRNDRKLSLTKNHSVGVDKKAKFKRTISSRIQRNNYIVGKSESEENHIQTSASDDIEIDSSRRNTVLALPPGFNEPNQPNPLISASSSPSADMKILLSDEKVKRKTRNSMKELLPLKLQAGIDFSMIDNELKVKSCNIDKLISLLTYDSPVGSFLINFFIPI